MGEPLMDDQAMLARIDEIIVENAKLLNEPVRLGVRVRPDGVRIQVRIGNKWRRGQYRHYSSIGAAYHAALEANTKAKRDFGAKEAR